MPFAYYTQYSMVLRRGEMRTILMFMKGTSLKGHLMDLDNLCAGISYQSSVHLKGTSYKGQEV